MDKATFNEVNFFEFRRLIGSERYAYSFIIYDVAEQSWGVLHITDYETFILKTSEKAQQPSKYCFDVFALSVNESKRKDLRFFIEPRFLGVSLARLILQQALRGENFTGGFPMPCVDEEPQYPCAGELNLYDHESVGILYTWNDSEEVINEVIKPARQIINYARRIMKDSMN